MSEKFAALYSPVQKCFHVETLDEALIKSRVQIYTRSIMKSCYIIFHIGTEKSCRLACDCLKKMMEEKDEN